MKIRLTHFVYVYGPGAILDTPRGPGLIPHPYSRRGGLASGISLSSIEIPLSPSIRRKLGPNVKCYHLPIAHLYLFLSPHFRLIPFPEWSICRNPGHPYYVLFKSSLHHGICPVCSSKSHVVPATHVQICEDGHISDVDYYALVHSGRGKKSCRGHSYYEWHPSPTGLPYHATIECPSCGAHASLSAGNLGLLGCKGTYPERPYTSKCSKSVYILPRQSLAVRVPEVWTFIDVLPSFSSGHSAASASGSKKSMEAEDRGFLDEFDDLCEYAKEHPGKSLSVCGLRVVRIDKIQAISLQVGYRRIVGASSHPSAEGGSSIGGNLVSVAVPTDPHGGMPRGPYPPPSDWWVPGKSPGSYHWWIPGVEAYGEALFISLDECAPCTLTGTIADKWYATWEDSDKSPPPYPDWLFTSKSYFRPPPSRPIELHPVFVFWHTFAHLLIKALAEYAGYPSALLKERIYVDIDKKDNRKARAGILIYATQSGIRGTLGGLIALQPYMKDIIYRALEQAENCSNDPICIESHFTPWRHHSGPSCYACTLLSETSCEHRNMWLDRELFLEAYPSIITCT